MDLQWVIESNEPYRGRYVNLDAVKWVTPDVSKDGQRFLGVCTGNGPERFGWFRAIDNPYNRAVLGLPKEENTNPKVPRRRRTAALATEKG